MTTCDLNRFAHLCGDKFCVVFTNGEEEVFKHTSIDEVLMSLEDSEPVKDIFEI